MVLLFANKMIYTIAKNVLCPITFKNKHVDLEESENNAILATKFF
jgi:hypothetical protein